MKVEVKNKIVQALLSNKYPQDQGYLRTENGYCCLGVMCEVAIEEGVIAPALYDKRYYSVDEYFLYGGDDSRVFDLPESVREWAGMNSNEGILKEPIYAGGSPCTSLAELNDSGYSFEQIAKLIEEQYETL